MSKRAQRGYYHMPYPKKTLNSRLEAIRRVVPKGSTILDVGCNNGTIPLSLLKSGHAEKAFGYDLENIITQPNPALTLTTMDVATYDYGLFPQVDVAFALNIVHHLIGGAGPERARQFVDALLERAHTVIIDLGSFTEHGHWGWRQAFDRYWKSDHEMWSYLFRNAIGRYPLLQYRNMGHGHRTLWKLVGHRKRDVEYKTLQMFRRNVAVRGKKLYSVSTVEECPSGKKFGSGAGQICPYMVFEKLACADTDELFWAKRWVNWGWPFRFEFYMNTFVRTLPYFTISAIDCSDTHGLVFPFYPEITPATVRHYHDRSMFTAAEVVCIERFGNVRIEHKHLPSLSIKDLTDFQFSHTKYDLGFLDFAPWGQAKLESRSQGRLAESPISIESGPAVGFSWHEEYRKLF